MRTDRNKLNRSEHQKDKSCTNTSILKSISKWWDPRDAEREEIFRLWTAQVWTSSLSSISNSSTSAKNRPHFWHWVILTDVLCFKPSYVSFFKNCFSFVPVTFIWFVKSDHEKVTSSQLTVVGHLNSSDNHSHTNTVNICLFFWSNVSLG